MPFPATGKQFADGIDCCHRLGMHPETRFVQVPAGLFSRTRVWTMQMAITPFQNFAFLSAVDVVIVELASRPEPLSIR